MKFSKYIIQFYFDRIYRWFKPYYISIVQEMILNSNFWEEHEGEQWMAGRVEIHADGPYAEDEIRFFTDKKEWGDFVNKKEFSSYSKKGIKQLEKWINNNFNHPPETNHPKKPMFPEGKRCKHVRREGESCTLNNNCKYPNCELVDIDKKD